VNLTTQFVTTGLTTAWTRQPGDVVVTDPTNVSQAGTYRLIVTNASGCADTAQVVISYFPKPNLGVDRTTSICPNGNVDLTTQFTTTGLTTAWTLAGAPVANPSSVNQAGVYQLIGTNADGCKDTATVTIAINPRPNLGADRAGAFCPGESINLNTTFNLAGLSSAWTIIPAGTAVANPAAVNQGGAYQVIATNSFGCADTATITLTENPKPSLGADKQFNICPNETVNLTTQYNTNNLTVAWTLNGTPVGNPAQVNQPGAYQLIVTNAAGCKDTAVVQVTVVARPNLGADRVVAICANQVVNLTTQFTLTGLTTVWTSGIAPVVDPTTITTAGIYQVIASNAAGCADTALVTITVNPKPNLGIDRVVNICPGSTANLSAQFVTTGFTPVWTFGGAPVANPSSVSSAGVYQLIVTNPEGCRDTATATVVIDPKPNLGADKSVTTCPGTPVDLTTQFNLGGLTASWSFGNLLVANPSSVLAIGTYQVIVANSAGCRDTAQVTVGLNPKPSIGADKSLALCPGATTDLTTHYITTGLTATWSLGGIPVATPNTVAAAGVYMLVATNSVGCADTALLTITASPAPNLVITNPPRVCSPARADLTAASVTAGSTTGLTFTYWNDLNATSPVPNPASVPAGTFYIKATSGAGCTTIRPVVVNEFPRHQVFAGNDTAICTGSTITLRGLVNGGSLGTTTILWSPADSLSSTGSLTTLANPTRTTRYTLTVTITNGTCVYEEKDSILVTVQPPVVANAGRDTVAVRNVPHQLNATGGLVYQWSPAGVLNNANISNPRATINQDTRFVVRVSDLVGCSATDTILVSVVDAVRYFVPNAFSPNGDGLNDVFRAVPIGVMRTEFFRVFNRFGELIFETNQPRAGWDGTFKGKPQQPGNYVWMLKGYGGNGQVIELSGNVMLVR
jgi:gliding motility-associated-like protein